VVFQQLDVALANHSGRAKDANGVFFLDSHKHLIIPEVGMRRRDLPNTVSFLADRRSRWTIGFLAISMKSCKKPNLPITDH
jgi:hypothetical protein